MQDTLTLSPIRREKSRLALHSAMLLSMPGAIQGAEPCRFIADREGHPRA